MPDRTLPRLRLFLAVTLLTLFTGCATNWSEAEKKSLGTVQLTAASVAKDAYQKPDVRESPGMERSITTATGGGLIPSLIGSAIDASVMASQQRKFEAANAAYLEGLHAALPVAPNKAVDDALRVMLAANNFFGSRLQEKATNAFFIEILQYGLAKSPFSSKEDITLRVRIQAKITLRLADGSTLFETGINGAAHTAKSPAEIVADPGFYQNGATEAADDLAGQLRAMLEQKLYAPPKK